MGNKSSKPIVISLEGNIGTGKSTFFEELRKYYHNDPTICFLPEPVEEWNAVKDVDGVACYENHKILF